MFLQLFLSPRVFLSVFAQLGMVLLFSSTEQMPGTATKGYTDLITLSPENVDGTSGVADQVVILNVKID